MIVLDAETAPLPLADIKEIVGPFDDSNVRKDDPGEFDPDQVKTGNRKDETKAKYIEERRVAHEKAVKDFAKRLEGAEEAYWSGLLDKAALNARLGSIVAIGMYRDDLDTYMAGGIPQYSEKDLLHGMWTSIREALGRGDTIVTFNGHGFDFPFFERRSWKLGIEVPEIRTPTGWFKPNFVDLAEKWRGKGQDYIKLDDLGMFLLGRGKYDEISGKDFHLAWSDPERRPIAEAYLREDVMLTWELAVQMGVQ